MKVTSQAQSALTHRFSRWILLVGYALIPPSMTRADDPPERPMVLMCVPPGGILGQSVQVKARGLRLEGVTEIRSPTEGISFKFHSSGKVATPPGLNAQRAGDTEVVFELTLPLETNDGSAELTFVAPHGQSTYQLPLLDADSTIREVEPNPGFQQAQAIGFPQVILGQIERAYDVDVYAVELTAGQHVRLEVSAEAQGSAMDALLTLTDSDGTTVVTNDDHNGSRDAWIETSVANSGRYFLVVQDANDLGGDAHPYRLTLAAGQPPVSFVCQIAPILQARCVACHDATTTEGGYRLDTFHHLISSGDSGAKGFTANNPAASESFRRIISNDVGQRMPLDADPLSSDQITLIRRWLEEGAQYDGTDPDQALISQIPVIHPEAPEHYSASLPLGALAFSPDGDALLVGGYHEITLWHPTQGRLLRRVGQVAQRTYSIAWHPAGTQFAVACGNPGQLGEVRLFSADGQLQTVLTSTTDVVHDVAYSPSGDSLAIATSDGSICVYDLEQRALELKIHSHLDWVLAVAWSPDGSKVASASRDKTAKVFDTKSGMLIASYAQHNAPVRGVLFHPSGDEVYSSGDNDRWERWKVSDAQRVRDMHLGDVAFRLVGIGGYFLVPSANNRVHLMKAHESERIREFHCSNESRMISVAALEPADLVAAGTQTGDVIVWELSTGKQVAKFRALPSSSAGKEPAAASDP